VSWKGALKYCRDLRLAGYSDWRLATLAELGTIYDRSANAPGLASSGKDNFFTCHVKGNLFLTGDEWSNERINDDRGQPSRGISTSTKEGLLMIRVGSPDLSSCLKERSISIARHGIGFTGICICLVRSMPRITNDGT
jgi:hypothetical protein